MYRKESCYQRMLHLEIESHSVSILARESISKSPMSSHGFLYVHVLTRTEVGLVDHG
jgi:hypothetical protein